MSSATMEMQRVLGKVPSQSSEHLGWANLTAHRWRHGDLHDRTMAMTEHVVMVYVSDGDLIERHSSARQQSARMTRATTTIIPSGSEAYWDLEGPIEIVHAYVKPRMLQSFADEHDLGTSEIRERLCFEDPTGSQILTLLATELSRGNPGNRLFADHLCGLLCLHLLREHTESNGVAAASRLPSGGLSPWQLARVIALMTSAVGRDHSLADLSREAGLSPFHFSRMFKAATGLAPHRWLTQKRIERARELLGTTDQPMADVATAVGYPDPSYFARLFKKQVGITPASYRRTCKF